MIQQITESEDSSKINNFTETLLADMISQLDVLDPSSDQEEILMALSSESPELLLKLLFGVGNLSEYAEDIMSTLEEDEDE